MTWSYSERCICDGDDCDQFIEAQTYNPVQRKTLSTDLLEGAEARGWMMAREDNIAYCPMHTQLYISAWSQDPEP